MNFSFLTPLPPRTRVPLFGGVGVGGVGGGVGGGGGGVKTTLRIEAAVCGIGPEVRGNFFLVHGPPNPWWGSRVRTLGTPGRPPLWALASEDLAVFTLDKACLVTPARFLKLDFFGNPSVALGMGLGDDLVTIRVLEHPRGTHVVAAKPI